MRRSSSARSPKGFFTSTESESRKLRRGQPPDRFYTPFDGTSIRGSDQPDNRFYDWYFPENNVPVFVSHDITNATLASLTGANALHLYDEPVIVEFGPAQSLLDALSGENAHVEVASARILDPVLTLPGNLTIDKEARMPEPTLGLQINDLGSLCQQGCAVDFEWHIRTEYKETNPPAITASGRAPNGCASTDGFGYPHAWAARFDSSVCATDLLSTTPIRKQRYLSHFDVGLIENLAWNSDVVDASGDGESPLRYGGGRVSVAVSVNVGFVLADGKHDETAFVVDGQFEIKGSNPEPNTVKAEAQERIKTLDVDDKVKASLSRAVPAAICRESSWLHFAGGTPAHDENGGFGLGQLTSFNTGDGSRRPSLPEIWSWKRNLETTLRLNKKNGEDSFNSSVFQASYSGNDEQFARALFRHTLAKHNHPAKAYYSGRNGDTFIRHPYVCSSKRDNDQDPDEDAIYSTNLDDPTSPVFTHLDSIVNDLDCQSEPEINRRRIVQLDSSSHVVFVGGCTSNASGELLNYNDTDPFSLSMKAINWASLTKSSCKNDPDYQPANHNVARLVGYTNGQITSIGACERPGVCYVDTNSDKCIDPYESSPQ